MDRLEVELTPGDDPEVRVKFQRFRTADRGEDPPCLSNWPTGSTTGPAAVRWLRQSRERTVPGGAGWRYVFGSALDGGLPRPGVHRPAADDVLQPVVVDAPGASVYYINHEMWLRLVHPGRAPFRARRP